MKKTILNKIVTLLLLSVMVSAMLVEASALQAVTDLDRKGSITVALKEPETKQPLAGGSLTLIQVCGLEQSGLVYVPAFQGCSASLEKVGSPETAKTIADFAESKNMTGKTVEIDNEGKAVFSELPLGMYLIVQNEAAEGYEEIESFLVTVPAMQDGFYQYDVDAAPKVGEINKRTTEPTGQEHHKPHSWGNRLPQTGQLVWPIPVLAFLGVACLLIGIKQRKNSKEVK